MKPKKVNKKLSFNKSTIANLNSKDLNTLRGGATIYQSLPCASCPQFCTKPPTHCNTCHYTCDDYTCAMTCQTCDYDPESKCVC